MLFDSGSIFFTLLSWCFRKYEVRLSPVYNWYLKIMLIHLNIGLLSVFGGFVVTSY